MFNLSSHQLSSRNRNLVWSHLASTRWAAALGLALWVVGCKSPMSARRDAAAAPDAGMADASPTLGSDAPGSDALVGPDLGSPDLIAPSTPDLAAADLRPDSIAPSVTPKGFRFVNETNRPAYISTSPTVFCRTQDSSGAWQDCSFWQGSCSQLCDDVAAGNNCCVMCGQTLPRVLYVPAGQSVSVAWDGNIFTENATLCSDCACEIATPIPAGSYQARAFAFPGYRCETDDCFPGSDGVIDQASPVGTSTAITTTFSIPFGSDELVLDINILSMPDAGIVADAPEDNPSTEDSAHDALPSAFAGLPGHAFEIAAVNTPPDASVQGSTPCRSADTSAHYALAFSSDLGNVQITRTDPVQEPIVNGTLSSQSDTRLVYNLTNLFAGGQLTVEIVDGKLVAQYAVFGSGVSVVDCIQSTMT
jgi:hypothetical protein